MSIEGNGEILLLLEEEEEELRRPPGIIPCDPWEGLGRVASHNNFIILGGSWDTRGARYPRWASDEYRAKKKENKKKIKIIN